MTQPEPDTKDWTWVLERPCDYCGFDATTLDPKDVAGLIRSNAASWREVLGRGEIVRTRPPGHDVVWSALEYGAHVRDVHRLGAERVTLMLTEDNPEFADWDQDETAAESNYLAEDPAKVAYELAVAAGAFAGLLDKVKDTSWDRPGLRSNGSRFTIASFAKYALHDPVHHLKDVELGFEALAELET